MDEYNVNEYTDEQLLKLLDLENPSDRILEAKILNLVRKYSNIGNQSGNKLSQFFIDIYNRFFENVEVEVDDEDADEEVFTIGNGNVYNSAGVIGTPLPGNVIAENIFSSTDLSQPGNGVIGIANMGNVVSDPSKTISFTKEVEYPTGNSNPLMKETIKRIISIDSQYRNKQSNSPSTNFTFNLSEPLKDVVSLSLYSVQIPYTWYTVNSDFGGNFFYLKGNAPGINTGLHDYKISIPAGNYTPSALITTLNTSIKKVASTYTDVSFGITQALYNNGSGDAANGSGRCSLYIDIKKVYNESNYTLSFPTWSNPRIKITPSGEGIATANKEKLRTIPGYLGFNNREYYCSAIYSLSIPSYNTLTSYMTNPKIIATDRTKFSIVPYIGENLLTADISFALIDVSLNLNGITLTTFTNMVTLMNNAVKSNPKLDTDFTECELIDISNSELYDSSYSYVKLKCKLKNSCYPGVRNLKLAAVFPQDASSIFYGANSFFCFSDLGMTDSSNVICEFNELLSEHGILESNYDASNTYVSFTCKLPGYYDSSNNITTAPIPSTKYTLNNFISAINDNINTAINNNVRFKNSKISMNSDNVTSKLTFNTTINNTYVNSDYYIYTDPSGSADLSNILSLPTSPTGRNPLSTFNNSSYVFNDVTFNALNKIYIRPISTGNMGADEFIINFRSSTFSNPYQLATYLTDVISGYPDPSSNLFPLSGSNVTYSITSKFTLNLKISLNIDQRFYTLTLHSENAVWKNLFKGVGASVTKDISYNLIDYSSNGYTVTSDTSVTGNEITITKDNNTFYFSPSNLVNVFSSSADQYKITVTIDSSGNTGRQYAINDLLTAINTQLSTTIAAGTVFSTEVVNGVTVIKVKFNINQVFTTKDYNLVFYDPYSFTSCFSNRSRNTTTSLQNATWDTTLGWLLGYRNEISYTLSDYANITEPDKTDDYLIYYLSDYVSDSSVCVLIGDTNVSTNLYNYFLIMLDDYVQNHLNDGLVTITNQETVINTGPYVYVCDPVTGQKIAIPAEYGTPGINYTSQQLYAFNQQVQSQIVKQKSYSNGPFVQDIFGIIPVKTSGMQIGSVYVEFGGSLQSQQRLYFGPVNIHRMTIKLLNDRGNLVDLNNANWSFSFICEQLYKSSLS